MKNLTGIIASLLVFLSYGRINAQVTADAGPDQSYCFGLFNDTLGGNPTASGGTGPYTYVWSPAANLNCLTCPNPIISLFFPAAIDTLIYILTVTDSLGATATDSVTVIAYPGPVIDSVITTNPSACTSADGTIALTGLEPSQLYTVNYNYSLGPQPPVNLVTDTSGHIMINGLNSGYYTNLEVILNGCISQHPVRGPFILSAPSTLTVDSISGAFTTCGLCNAQVMATVSGGSPPYTYSYLELPLAPRCAAIGCDWICGGRQMIFITMDANGCLDSAAFTIAQSSAVQIDSFTVTNVSCFGGNDGSSCAYVSGGTPPYNYVWSDTQVGQCPGGRPKGTYFVTVTDATGCQSFDSLIIAEPALLNVQIINTGDGILPDTFAALASGGCSSYTYAWSNGSTSQQSVITAYGTYDVTVTDSCGCSAVDSIVIAPSSITVTYPNGGESFTTGQNVNVLWTSTGNIPKVKIEFYSSIAFNWITLVDSVVNSGSYSFTIPQISNMQGRIRISDPYNAAVNDQSDSLFYIVQAGALVVTPSVSNVSCNGLSDGSVILSVSGGSLPYQYSIDGGVTFQPSDTFQNLSSGNYSVIINDAGSSADTISVAITEPGQLQIDTILITNVTCFGLSDGTACIRTIGGTPFPPSSGLPPNTYIWNVGQPDSCNYNLTIGTYAVTVADMNNCTASASFTITEPPALTAQFVYSSDGIVPDTVLCYVAGGTPFIWTGVPTYVVDWGDGSVSTWDTSAHIYYADGIYIITVADSNGCQIHDTLTIGCLASCVWPGDADYNGRADNYDLLPIGLAYGTTGTARLQQDVNWYGHPSQDWTDTLASGVNYKHSDCDGNGTVNATDTLAILQNFLLTHAKRSAQKEWRMTDPALQIDLVPDTTQTGDTMYANLHLGDINVPANNVYGLAFTVNYDATVVDTSKTTIAFGNSWLGTSTDKIFIAKDLKINGQIRCAVTRIDHTTRSGYGQIGQASFVITTDNINGKDALAYYQMDVWISDLVVIDNLGNILSVNEGSDSAQVEYELTGVGELEIENYEMRIHPNPASSDVQVRISENLVGGELKLFDVIGKVLLSSTVTNRDLQFTTHELGRGIYLLQIVTQNGIISERLLIAH